MDISHLHITFQTILAFFGAVAIIGGGIKLILEATTPFKNLIKRQDSTNHSWMLRIRGKSDSSGNGNVYFSRYRNPSVAAGAYSNCVAGAWLSFHATWILE